MCVALKCQALVCSPLSDHVTEIKQLGRVFQLLGVVDKKTRSRCVVKVINRMRATDKTIAREIRWLRHDRTADGR